MDETIKKLLLASGRLKEVATSQQARDFDRFSVDEIGIKPELLMENAGNAVACAVASEIGHGKESSLVLVFCGPGNNGADALVSARHLLSRGINCILFFIGEQTTWSQAVRDHVALLTKALERLDKEPERILRQFKEDTDFSYPDKKIIVVDGIFGAGLSRKPSGLAKKAIDLINTYRKQHPHDCLVISIDIPSGLSLEACAPEGQFVKADRTITFDYLKRAHISEPTKALCGQSQAVPIGLFANSPCTNFYISEQVALSDLFVSVPSTCHKGNFGHVLVYEGHPNFLGASRLCARAALRAGAGLVTIATGDNKLSCSFDLPEFMHCPKKKLSKDLLKKIDAFVVGPGLGSDSSQLEEAVGLVNSLKHSTSPLVFDADGLRLLARPDCNIQGHRLIATPHPKEAANLLSCDLNHVERDRFWAIDALATLPCNKDNEIIWVLKGATTLVRAPDGDIFAFFGELPVLSVGGSGDVLSGAIAGLLKQSSSPLAATLLAVSLQIDAAKRLSKTIFKGSFASELADLFPLITKHRSVIN